MSWVRVPPEAADFSLKKSSSGVVELCCFVHVLCIMYTFAPDDFILNNDKLIFKKQHSQNISLTIVDSHMSGINKNFTLCLGVEANEKEIRAKVTAGTKCVNVTIINSNGRCDHNGPLSGPSPSPLLSFQWPSCLSCGLITYSLPVTRY